MMESVTDEVDDLVEEADNQVERINSLIMQFIELKMAISKSNELLHYWGDQMSGLSISNCAKEIKYEELQKKESQMRAVILQMVELEEQNEQELRRLHEERIKEEFEKWEQTQRSIASLAKNFVNAQMEYSIENLTKDIERYHEKSKEVSQELTIVQAELMEMESKYGMTYLMTDVDTEGVSKISAAITDIRQVTKRYRIAFSLHNENQLQQIKSIERTLEKVLNEKLQSKIVLEEYKNEEKTQRY
ncbi:hypothetical protein KM043_015624 [Ampulex compressa]|nr:hypothetical protein KM043_015624 [Ampulex compressa]